MQFEIQQNTHYPDAGYVDRPGTLGKFVGNSTKVPCLEFSQCRIKNSTVYGFWNFKLHVVKKV
jgi:hypothetical protein